MNRIYRHLIGLLLHSPINEKKPFTLFNKGRIEIYHHANKSIMAVLSIVTNNNAMLLLQINEVYINTLNEV